jgi:excisionase family DNA binding protein
MERKMTRSRLHRFAALILQDRYTIDEAAELLGLSAALIRRAARSGKLVAVPGEQGGFSLRHEDVMTWLRRRPYAAEPVIERMGMYQADSKRSMR